MSATPIEISVGGSRWASSWAQDLMTWEDFTESLSRLMSRVFSLTTTASDFGVITLTVPAFKSSVISFVSV